MHTPLAGTALHRDSHLRRRDCSPLSATISRSDAAASFCRFATASPCARENCESVMRALKRTLVQYECAPCIECCQMFSIAARTSPDAGRGDKDRASQSRASQQLGRRHASITLRVCIVSCSQANRFPMPRTPAAQRVGHCHVW
jgi:hypothetical protein